VSEFFWNYGLSIILGIAGMLVCTGGGLLALTPDPERPAVFVPVYVASLLIFIAGLALIMWCGNISEAIHQAYLAA